MGLADFPAALAFLFEQARYKVVVGGRGSGKSWGFARALLILGARRKIRVLCTREIQKSIKDSVHRLLKDQVFALGLESFYDVLNTEIRGINGTEFLFAGLSDQTADSIKSYEGVDVAWVEEAQTVSKRSWDIFVPTIRKDGSEIWVSFNPELESDETYSRFVANTPDDAVVVRMNYNDNPWFPEVLESERLHAKRTMLDEDYQNIWEGRCRTAVSGAIYAQEVFVAFGEGRIRNVPYDPLHVVHCIWDLGWNDSMSIIFVQRVASELRVIDYLEDSHRTLDWYVAEIRKRPYHFGDDWLPHDGEHRDFKTGKSAKEILEGLGRTVQITPNVGIEDGIRTARQTFGRVYFDAEKAGRLIECLKRYRRSINKETREPGAPLHDEFSHGADVFRYLCLVADQLKNPAERMAHPIFHDPRLARGRAPATRTGY